MSHVSVLEMVVSHQPYSEQVFWLTIWWLVWSNIQLAKQAIAKLYKLHSAFMNKNQPGYNQHHTHTRTHAHTFSVCLSLFVCLSLSLCLSVCLSLSLSVSLCVSLSKFIGVIVLDNKKSIRFYSNLIKEHTKNGSQLNCRIRTSPCCCL